MSTFNFTIQSTAAISTHFIERRIGSFADACSYIRQLPYKRNTDKHNSVIVFSDSCGTCSTKHALLKQLAIENKADRVKLLIGIFNMSGTNTPAVKLTLEKNGLTHIPEAHTYLKVDDEIIDCTKNNFGPENFVADLVAEIEIQPEQITAFKVQYHQQLLKQWLSEQAAINLSFDEIWAIREQCIACLSQ